MFPVFERRMMSPAFAFLVVVMMGAASLFASAKQTAHIIPKVVAVHVKPSVSCATKIGAALQAAGCHSILRTNVQTTLASMCSFEITNSCDYSSAVLKANGFLQSYKVSSIDRPKPFKITPPPVAADKASAKSFNPKAEFGFDITGVLEARTSLNLTGTGIKLAIIDTGVYYLHPALGGGFGPGYKVAFGYDLVGDNYDGTSSTTIVPDSDPIDNCSFDSHGTHVAGIVAANATRITKPGFVPYAPFTGVAPGVTLGAYRVFGCSANFVGTDVVAAAILRAAQDGADIINLSIVAPGYADDISVVAAETVSKAGHIVVAANGNDGAAGAYTASVPAASAGAIGVANFQYSNTFLLPSYVDVTLSPFSSVGLTDDLFLKPDIGAVGTNVYSTISSFAADSSSYSSAYAIYSGTSMSSPYVAGCIALLLQKRGKIGFNAARAYLQNTATITNFPDTTCTPVTNKASFHSPAFQGAGLVHIYKAATTGTLVTPSSLSLNDTANRKPIETIRIQNNYRVAVTFTLSHVAGATANTFNAGDDFVLEQGPQCVNNFPTSDVTTFSSTNIAKVKYANTTPYNVTIKAGKALNVSFQIIAPVPASPDLWSLYGGYIVITNSFDNIVTHIPYAGVAGKWKDRPIWSRNSSTLYSKWGLNTLNSLFGVQPASVATGLYANRTFTPLSKLEVVNASTYGYVLAPAASSSRSANITITYLCSNDTALKALGLQRTNLVGLVDLSRYVPRPGDKKPYLPFLGVLTRNTYYNQQGLLAPHVYGFDGKVFKGNTTVTLPAGVYKMYFTAWKNFGSAKEVDIVTTPPFQLIYKTPLSKQTLAKCPV